MFLKPRPLKCALKFHEHALERNGLLIKDPQNVKNDLWVPEMVTGLTTKRRDTFQTSTNNYMFPDAFSVPCLSS